MFGQIQRIFENHNSPWNFGFQNLEQLGTTRVPTDVRVDLNCLWKPSFPGEFLFSRRGATRNEVCSRSRQNWAKSSREPGLYAGVFLHVKSVSNSIKFLRKLLWNLLCNSIWDSIWKYHTEILRNQFRRVLSTCVFIIFIYSRYFYIITTGTYILHVQTKNLHLLGIDL